MKPHLCNNDQKKSSETISLKCLETQLLLQFQLLAVRHRSFIINDVPGGFYVCADKHRIHSSCIRISAKRYKNIILFRLKVSNAAFTSTHDTNWQQINNLAEKLGGCIIEDHTKSKQSRITFSFCSLANAA